MATYCIYTCSYSYAIFVVLWISFLLPGLAEAAKESPYLIEKKAFKKQVRSVALSPLEVPSMLTLSDEMRAYIEAEATKALSKTKLKAQFTFPEAIHNNKTWNHS